MKKHRRKTEFIDPEVQGALARRISMHWLLYTLVITFLVVGLKCMANPFTPIGNHLIEAWNTHGTLLLVLLALMPLFVFDAVRLSNRFIGPIRRLRAATKALANGERPQPVNLRDGDFWRDLAEDFNRVIHRVPTGNDQAPKTTPD